jgi:tRNA threonylcarbamoyladenosine biosynthesis protein TsaB
MNNQISPILAIETSDKICGVCLLKNFDEYYSVESNKSFSHSEIIFKQIEMVQHLSSLKLKEIKALAVSIGPGSFTGLRIGLSAAKGISIGLGVPIIPVPTFEALAYQISSFLPDKTEFIIANRANKDECYFAKFFVNSNSYIFDSELKLINQSELDNFNQIKIFGNAIKNNNAIASPSSEYVAKWAYNFGIGKLTSEIDFLEPNYIKDFIVRR